MGARKREGTNSIPEEAGYPSEYPSLMPLRPGSSESANIRLVIINTFLKKSSAFLIVAPPSAFGAALI